MKSIKKIRDQKAEVSRLKRELKELGPEYSPDGIVRTILTRLVQQEIQRLRRMVE